MQLLWAAPSLFLRLILSVFPARHKLSRQKTNPEVLEIAVGFRVRSLGDDVIVTTQESLARVSMQGSRVARY